MRPFALHDAEGLLRLNANPNVLRYTGDRPFKDADEAKTFIKYYRANYDNGFGRFTVLNRNDESYLGWCGFRKVGDDIDLGFRFLEEYWNQGYATECARACLDWIRDEHGVKEVIGRALPENTASIRVLEKLGMSLWKTGPCDDFEGALLYRIRF
jgi:RimJ/RimL family protein N-acetyltransferase